MKTTTMENYITLFNSITNETITSPFNNTEIELVKSAPIYNASSGQLVRMIYDGLMSKNEVEYFTASLVYLLKSETYKVNKLIGNNAFPIYVSRGNGTGFCRMCGGISATNAQDAANQAPMMIDMYMSMFGEKQSVRPTRNGSNYTKPKKRKK